MDKKAGSFRSQLSLSFPAECDQVNLAVNRVDVEWDSSTYSRSYKSEVSQRFNITGMNDDQFKKRLTIVWV